MGLSSSEPNKQIPKHHLIPQKGVKVFGSQSCYYCGVTRKYLDNNKIKYNWVDVTSRQGQSQRSVLSKHYQWSTIPMVFVDGEFIGGNSNFMQIVKNKDFYKKLEKA